MTVLRPGFDDPVLDTQRTFRAALEAMAHPGRVISVRGPADPPPPLTPAVAALCLTLLDGETPLWIDTARSAVVEYLRFHCGCPLAPADAATFALICDAARLDPSIGFALGTDEEPEAGATLIVKVERLVAGEGPRLIGPGIDGETRLRVPGLPAYVWCRLGAASGRFPRGVDAFLVSRDAIAAIPRTARIED